MSELAKRLNERRLSAFNEAKGIADRAGDENRAFSGDEEQTWTRLNDEIDTLDERIKSVIAMEQRGKDADAAMFGGKERTGGQPGDSKGEELRSWARGEGDRSYVVRPAGPVDFRALSKLSAGAGANTVPQSFYNKLMAHLIDNSAILQAGVTVLNTTSGETLPVPKTTAHSTGALVAEAGTIGTSDPAFGVVNLGSYKYGAKIQVSTELLTDTGVDLEGYLAMQAGRSLGNAFGVHAVVGTGSSQPRGVVTDATLGKTGPASVTGGFGAQATAGQGADVLIDLYHSVIAPYRQSSSCRWIMNDTTAATIRKIKTTDGQYIWQPSLVAGNPDTLLGKPALADPNVAAIALSAKSVLFGDFSQFFVRLVGGVRFERSDDFAFDSDLVTFRALMRADSALVDLTGAVKYFQGNAA
ncbi:phage major capsid protein [Streptomyces sp. NPDC058466]|uniref:phage major capsid protein n=1 Tax=Streptomyces sp. NPDC058466 TaxID=3346512 RepID=UPI0036663104